MNISKEMPRPGDRRPMLAGMPGAAAFCGLSGSPATAGAVIAADVVAGDGNAAGVV
jgi:hypothetical protein